MQAIIVYGSRYGTTKRYADMLSSKTGIKAAAYDSVQNLTGFDTVLYLGGLYAGSVTGLSKTAGNLSMGQSVILVTVGPVSYTHLDVYKRQPLQIPDRTCFHGLYPRGLPYQPCL